MLAMGKSFLPDDVNQWLLFPPSLHDWLPEGHLARFLVDVVSALDLRAIFASYEEKDGRGRMRHLSIQEQVNHLNQMLRGHYAYYGVAGNLRALLRVHRAVEQYWRKMLSSRSWHGTVRWEQFQRIKGQFPLLRPKLHYPYRALQAIAIL